MPSPLEQVIPVINVPVWQALIVGAVFFIVYLLVTRKPKAKEFKPLDLKKETKKYTNKEFKYFGTKCGVYIYSAGDIDHANKMHKKPKAFGYVIGIMKSAWNERYKRYVPAYSVKANDPRVIRKMETASKEVYKKSFKDLNDKQKVNIRKLAKEEVKDEYVEVYKEGTTTRIVRGKKEIIESKPIGLYILKITAPNIINITLGKLLGFGTDYFRFDAHQLNIGDNMIEVKSDYQRKIYNDQFIFSEAGKKSLDDIGFEKDREQQLQAIANQTSKVQFFDSGMGKDIERLREAYRLEADKRKIQKEAHDRM